VGKNEQRLREVHSKLAGSGHSWVQWDLSDLEQLPSFVNKALSEMGVFDAAFHGAGIHNARPARLVTPEDGLSMFATNFHSPFLITTELLAPERRASTFSVVFMGSASTTRGSAGIATYAASKAALLSLTRSLAVEWAPFGIRCNAIVSGIVETPMTLRLRRLIGDEAWARLAEQHPLGPGSVGDVANVALFLLSPASSWITGSAVTVDGGFSAN